MLAAGVGWKCRLEWVAALIDWVALERLRVPRGCPGYPPLALFRALLLAQWSRRSDPGLEEALADRLLFRRFCGFGLDDGTPDETTVCWLRSARRSAGLPRRCSRRRAGQLDAGGLRLKAGMVIDAALVEAAVARPPASEGEVTTKDLKAGFTRRGRQSVLASRHRWRSTLAPLWCARRC